MFKPSTAILVTHDFTNQEQCDAKNFPRLNPFNVNLFLPEPLTFSPTENKET